MEPGHYLDTVYQLLRYKLWLVSAMAKKFFVEPVCRRWQSRTMALILFYPLVLLTPNKFSGSVDLRHHGALQGVEFVITQIPVGIEMTRVDGQEYDLFLVV